MIDMHSPYCCYVTGVVFYTCCDVYYALLTLKVPKEQMKKFMSAKLKKKKILSRLCDIENSKKKHQTM